MAFQRAFVLAVTVLSFGSCSQVDHMKMPLLSQGEIQSSAQRPPLNIAAAATSLKYAVKLTTPSEDVETISVHESGGKRASKSFSHNQHQTEDANTPASERLSRRDKDDCYAHARFETALEEKVRTLEETVLDGEERTTTGAFSLRSYRPTKPCGPSGMCRCRGRCAWCSDLGTNLTFLPDMSSENITSLNFSGNYLPHITRRNMANATGLLHLALVNSHVRAVDVDAFEDLHRVQDLNLDGNPLNGQQLKNAIQSMASMQSLIDLGLNDMGLPNLPRDFFRPLNQSKIRFVYLMRNELTTYDHHVFLPLRSLRYVEMASNGLNESILAYDSHITNLNLFNNNLQSFPKFCPERKAVFPSLEFLMLDGNSISDIHPEQYDCMTKLKILSIDLNPIKIIRGNMFSSLKSIQVIYLQYMPVLAQIEGFAFNSSSLEKVYIKGCHLHFNYDQINMSHAFRTCPRLNFLEMSTNQLQYSREYMWGDMFSGMASLNFLSIGDGHLPFFPRAIGLLTNLTKLSIAINDIASWDHTIFQNLTKISSLFIQRNQLTVINQSNFPVSFLSNLTAIDISENPIVCSCGWLWFLQWFQTHPHVIKSSNFTTCHNTGVLLRDYHLSAEACELGEETKLLLPALMSFLIVSLIAGLALYRHRFRLYHVIHQLRYAGMARRRPRGDNLPRYHAYLAYCDSDIPWVVREAVPALEREHGLQLCIRHRNFEVGAAKVDNIESGLADSACVVLVISHAALRDSWWQYEREVAVAGVVEGEGQLKLLVVLLEEVGPLVLDRSLQRLLQRSPYFTWHHLQEAKQLFWERLAGALTPAFRGVQGAEANAEGGVQ